MLIVGQLVTWCGQSFDHWLDTMTVPRLKVLQNVWKYDPPVALVAARYCGVKGRPKRMSFQDQAGELAAFGFNVQSMPKAKVEPIPTTLEDVKRMNRG